MAKKKEEDGQLGRLLSTNTATIQRSAESAYGHLGRITYVPPENEEDDIGSLTATRLASQLPSFHEVSPFKEWLPSPISAAYRPRFSAGHGMPFQSARSQKNWLVNHVPEAFLGNDELTSVLSGEVLPADRSRKQPISSALLSLGEITDVTNADGSRPRRALAVASGEDGHILQIIGLKSEKWGWNRQAEENDGQDGDDLLLGVDAANSTEEGFWSAGGVPIVTIKFVIDQKRHNPLRWLLVQTWSSTTVLEPESRIIPLKSRIGTHALHQQPLHVAPNPLFSIGTSQTGYSAHSDVAFNPPADTRSPQLVIIDAAGNWSLWDVTGNRLARSKVLKPVMIRHGNTTMGTITSLSLALDAEHLLRRVMWVHRSLANVSTSDMEPREDSPDSRSSAPKAQSYLLFPAATTRRSDLVLISDNTSVILYDVANDTLSMPFQVARLKSGEQILDIQIGQARLNQIVVLTNAAVILLGIKLSTRGELGLSVLSSCPHLRNPRDMTQRFSVVPAGQAHGASGDHLVCVYAASDARMTLIRFSGLESIDQVKFQRTTFPATTMALGESFGLQGLALIPSSLQIERHGKVLKAEAARDEPPGVKDAQFYQMYALGADLSLHSSLTALSRRWSKLGSMSVRKSQNELARRRKRQKYLAAVMSAFVVPDDYDNKEASSPLDQPKGSRRLLPTSIKSFPDKQAKALIDKIFDVADAANSEDEHEDHASSRAVRIIDDTVENGLEHGLSLITLKELLDQNGVLGSALNEYDVAELLARVDELRIGNEDVFQVHRLRFGGSADIRELIERVSNLSSESQVVHGDNHAEKERAAALRLMRDMVLSETAISIARQPIPATSTQAEHEPDDTPSPSPALSAPRSSSSQWLRPSTSSSQQSSQTQQETGEPPDEDPAITRLRRYVPSIRSMPPRPDGETRLLSNWHLGEDPWQYAWAEEAKSDAEDELARRRAVDDARRQRRLGKRSSVSASATPEPCGGGGGGSSGPASRAPSTQPLPEPWFGGPSRSQSQSRSREGTLDAAAAARAAETQPSSSMPSQAMSQPLAGLHGARPARKKGKKGTGFK